MENKSVPKWAKNAARELVEMHGLPHQEEEAVSRLIAWHFDKFIERAGFHERALEFLANEGGFLDPSATAGFAEDVLSGKVPIEMATKD